MVQRRLEIVPVCLTVWAVGALALSWLVVRSVPTDSRESLVDVPQRAAAPLRWRVGELPPLVVQAPKIESPAIDVTGPVEVKPPVDLVASATEDLQLGPTETDLLITHPVGAFLGNRLLVLLPREEQLVSRVAKPRLATRSDHLAWSVGPIDTLALARSAGQVAVQPTVLMSQGPRMRVLAQQAIEAFARSRIVQTLRVARASTPSVKPPEPTVVVIPPQDDQIVAAQKASLVLKPAAASTPGYRVVPIAPPVKQTPLSIVSYVQQDARGEFPVAVSLAEQLDRVAQTRQLAPWAWDVAFRLRALSRSRTDDPQASAALSALERRMTEAFDRAPALGDSPAATELRRAAYGLARRTTAWRAEQTQTLVMLERRTPAERLADARFATRGDVSGWMLADRPGREEVLRVAQRIEEYERQPSGRLARSLAHSATKLAQAHEQSAYELATAIESNYRNANVRIAIADELINRLLPASEPTVANVRDRIAGTRVTGKSTTTSQLRVRLTPDSAAWRVGLEARGQVISRTYSRGGPAVVGTRGSTDFVAEKPLVVTYEGLEALPTSTRATAMAQRLVSLHSNYDRVPLLGQAVRSAARDEYARIRRRAQAETKIKVERRVSEEMDQRVASQLTQLRQRFATQVTQRFENLGLEVAPVELRTTEQRLIGRVRIANNEQLAAHTPRMRAPSDSLLSVQMHESMLNNTLEGLGLSGATVTTEELRQRMAERLLMPKPTSRPGDQAVFRFAEQDAIRFCLADGRAELILALAELQVRGKRHRNFKVHSFYRPEVSGLRAELVQEGTPHIEGRLGTTSRIHLHGVLGKVLGERERIPLVRLRDDSPQLMTRALQGLVTNQLVIEDGWIGLAIGPQRPLNRLALQVGGYVR